MAEKSRWQCVKACTWNKKYWAYMSVYEGTETPPVQFFTLLGPVEEEPETGGGTGCGCGCGGLTETQVRAIAREEITSVCSAGCSGSVGTATNDEASEAFDDIFGSGD